MLKALTFSPFIHQHLYPRNWEATCNQGSFLPSYGIDVFKKYSNLWKNELWRANRTCKIKPNSCKWARKSWCALWHTQSKNQSLLAQDCPQKLICCLDFPHLPVGCSLSVTKNLGSVHSAQCSAGSVICYKLLSLVFSFEKGKKQKNGFCFILMLCFCARGKQLWESFPTAWPRHADSTVGIMR